MNGLSDVKRTLNGRYAVADGGQILKIEPLMIWAENPYLGYQQMFVQKIFKILTWHTWQCTLLRTMSSCHCDTTFNRCDTAVLSDFRTRLLEHAVIEGI